ncbi:transposase [Escherichia coli]|nr:transposase [Escherichia coli]
MELQDWRKEPRKNYSNEFKLRMVELASQPGQVYPKNIAFDMLAHTILDHSHRYTPTHFWVAPRKHL